MREPEGLGQPTSHDPLDYARPADWEPLPDGDEEAPPSPQQASLQQAPAAPPPPPAAAPPPPPAPRTEPQPAASKPRRKSGPPRPPVGKVQPRSGTRLVFLLFVALNALAAVFLLPSVAARVSKAPPPVTPSVSSRPQIDPIPVLWSVRPSTLRRDVTKPEFVPDLDGSFESDRALNVGLVWLVATDEGPGTPTVVHALDPVTGAERWHRATPEARCANRPLPDGIVCAEALANDPNTGLCVRWRLVVLDPATGAKVRHRDLDAWLSILRVREGRILLVEERLPAPHVVLTGLDAALNQTWQHDLAKVAGHADFFSDNRITNRGSRIPPGPALDRPRVRELSHGLTAFWSGSRTAFLDESTGRLVAAPWCTRKVDDGQRLWCNEPDSALTYGYDLTPTGVRTDPGVRLASVARDPRDGDMGPALFMDPDGGVLRVDPATGRTLGLVATTQNGSAFGMVPQPLVATSGNRAFLADGNQFICADPLTCVVAWSVPAISMFDGAYVSGDRVIVPDGTLHVLDLETGATRVAYRQDRGYGTSMVAGVFVGAGADELARLIIP